MLFRDSTQGASLIIACETAAKVQFCVSTFSDFAARVLVIGPQVSLNRLRSGDSILFLVSVLGRFISKLQVVIWNISSISFGPGVP